LDDTEKLTDGMVDLSGQEPPADTAGTSKTKRETPQTKTYTEEEFNQAINQAKTKAFSDFMAESGRKYKPIEDENKTLKSQLASNKQSIDEATATIEKLHSQIDDLAADDPDKKKLVKSLREVEDIQRSLKAERLNLESEKASLHKERAEVAAARLAKEYNVDETFLISLTDGSPDKMEMLAKVLPKKTAEKPKSKSEEKPEIIPDSGVTTGGASEDWEKMTMEQYANHPKVKNRYK
jgi:chromosome segregation ATPase